MRVMKYLWTGVFLASLTSTAQAVMITELFEIKLPVASGPYSAGHVFQITATYDDEGTVMHGWGDGANGIAEFGDGDDLLFSTYNLVDYSGYTLFSDAELSISGLAQLSAGASRLDVYDYNFSWYYEYLDPSDNGYWVLNYAADDIRFIASVYNMSQSPSSSFYLLQNYTDDLGKHQVLLARAVIDSTDGLITRTTVPEPTTLTLMGLGLAGIGFARKKRK